MGPRAGLDGCENLALTGIRSLDRPACSESLCRLNCPGPMLLQNEGNLWNSGDIANSSRRTLLRAVILGQLKSKFLKITRSIWNSEGTVRCSCKFLD